MTSRLLKTLAVVGVATTIATSFAGLQQSASVGGSAPKMAHPGKKIAATVVINVPAGFHIYSPGFKGTGVPTEITLEKASGFKLLKVGAPKGDLLEGKVVFHPYLLAPKVKGKKSLEFAVKFQQCNDRICLPPVTKNVSVTTSVR